MEASCWLFNCSQTFWFMGSTQRTKAIERQFIWRRSPFSNIPVLDPKRCDTFDDEIQNHERFTGT